MFGSTLTISTIATNARSSRPPCLRTSSTGTSSAKTSTPAERSGRTRKASARRSCSTERLLLELVSGLEDPGDGDEAAGDERGEHRHAGPHRHVGDRVEGPTEAALQVNGRVEIAQSVERLGQRLDRIEGAAEEGQRRDHQHRDDLQLLEILRQNADDEAEQAEGRGDGQQEQE